MDDEQILAIGVQLWTQSQGEAFTMDKLSEATGVSRATLYRRFGSREAILQRLVDDHALDIEALSLPDIPTRIMQATGVTLNRAGFAGVTIEMIAQEAGVGPATVYRHFGSKDALIEAFIGSNSPRLLLRSLVANAESDLEADLILLAKTMLEFMRDNQGLVSTFAFENRGSEAHIAKIRASQGRTIYMLTDYLAGHMALGNLQQGDAFALALSFMGILIGVGLVGPKSYDRPVTDLDAVARNVTQLFLHGIAPQHSSQHLPQHAQPSSQPTEAQR